MKSIKLNNYNVFAAEVGEIKVGNTNKMIINTINAHSYIIAKKDNAFKTALLQSDILLPDGEGIVLMASQIKQERIKKIAGADIHFHLLNIAEKKKLRCFYLGANVITLEGIKNKQSTKYPNISFGFYSPPFRSVFSEQENIEMIDKINYFNPDILFVGMTAPKQEKWVHNNKNELDVKIICSIGAVFDFIAETKKRAPHWVINLKMEWLYRSFTAWRLTKRYMYSTPLFLLEVLKLKYYSKNI